MKRPAVLTAEEFQLLNEFVAENFGLSFPDHKMSIMESKLRPRLAELNMNTFMDYYVFLQYNFNGERSLIARLVTNNETYFFRETYQFEAMFEHALDDIKKALYTPNTLRILCAGCSSGEEPYTLNIFLKENQYRLWGVLTEINAFDIDTDRLSIARKGEYTRNSLRVMEQDVVEKYFQKKADDRFALKPMYREGVQFAEANISNVATYRKPFLYDALYCRNVLIYFSEASLHAAVDNFAKVLRPGGLLFLGHSESIIGLSRFFETVKLGNCIAYKRTDL